MAVAGDVAGVVEIVEDAELASEFVLVGSDLFAVHGDGGVAVGVREIAEDLIVGTVFLNDVDHVADFVFAGSEPDAVGVALRSVGVGDLNGPGAEIITQLGEGDAPEGAIGHRRIIGIPGWAAGVFCERSGIGARAAAFGGGDEEVVRSGCDDGGVPLCGNEAEGLEPSARSKSVGEVENRYRVRNGVGGEEQPPIRGKRKRFRIATAIFLTGELGRKKVARVVRVREVDSVDFVAISESNEEAGVIARKKKSRGMGAAVEWLCGFAEGNGAHDTTGEEIEFGDGGVVPEGGEAAFAIVSDDSGVGQRAGNAFKGGEIETEDDFAVGGIEEKGFIGMVAGNEDALCAVDEADGEARGIGNVVEFLATEFPRREGGARREREETLGGDFAIFEFVDSDAVASTSLLFSERVGEGGHGGVEMLAVEAEGEAEEVGLFRADGEPVVGKVAKSVGFEVQNGEGLFLVGCVGGKTAVEEDGEVAVR